MKHQINKLKHARTFLRTIALSIGVLLIAMTGHAQEWKQYSKGVFSQIPRQKGALGASVDINSSGDVAVSGASLAPGGYYSGTNFIQTANNTGAAYVFNQINGNWNAVERLQPPNLSVWDNFGGVVAIGGDYIVVSAGGHALDENGSNSLNDAGAVFIYKKTNGSWTLLKKLVAPVRHEGDVFGSSIDIAGDLVVVGCLHYDEPSFSNTGTVFVFDKNAGGVDNFGYISKITPNTLAIDSRFGIRVKIEGTTIAVSNENGYDASNTNYLTKAGAVYLFNRTSTTGVSQWTQFKKIVASDRGANEYFGSSLEFKNNYLVVGAKWDAEDELGTNPISGAGSTYIFAKDQGGTNNWGLVKKLVAPIREINDEFGMSISLSGNYLAVGTTNEKEDATESNSLQYSGAIYIYSKDLGGVNNWGLQKKLCSPDRMADEYYGYCIAMAGNEMIVGAPKNTTDHRGLNPISGYDWQISGCTYFIKNTNINTNNILGDALGSNLVQEQGSGNTHYFDNQNRVIAKIQPIGTTTALSGAIAISVENNSSSNFAGRSYQITPFKNASTSTAKITLYYPESLFTTFNSTNAIKMPTSASDAAGIANLRIYKYSGYAGGNGELIPSNYSGSPIVIDPADADIVFNSTTNAWEVTFDVTGFSGFFLGTESNASLGVNWKIVKGSLSDLNESVIDWKVQENNVNKYEIEKSLDGNSFEKIGEVASKGNGENSYSFTEDTKLYGAAFYRIRQVETDGKSDYSKVVTISSTAKNNVSIFPNPAKNYVTVSGADEDSKAILSDITGKVLHQWTISNTEERIDLSSYANGIYFLKLENGMLYKIIKE